MLQISPLIRRHYLRSVGDQRVIVPSPRVVISFLHRLSCESILTVRSAGPFRSRLSLAVLRVRYCDFDLGHRLRMRSYEKGCVAMARHAISAKTARTALPSVWRFGF